MRSTLYILTAVVSGSHVDDCKAQMLATAPPQYADYCAERCVLWSEDYGVAHCGDLVMSDFTALLECVYKMEGPACSPSAPPGDQNPDSPPEETTAAETTTERVTTRPTTSVGSSKATTRPTSGSTTRASTKATTAKATTTKATTTKATTTKAITKTTTTPARVTTQPPASPPHEQNSPGFWSPDDAPENKLTGPTGADGECIWGYTGATAGGQFAGVTNRVYRAKYYAGESDQPGVSDVWEFVTICDGSAPSVLTLADMNSMVKDPTKPTIFYDPWTPAMPSRAEINDVENTASQDPQVQILRDAVRVLSSEEVEAIYPENPSNPDNVKRVETFLTSETFEQIFPFRHEVYSYENYLKAVGAYPDYCKTYDDGRDSDSICKKLVAASFAHYSQETGANAPAWTLNMNDCPPENVHEEARKYFDPNTPIPTYLQGLYWIRETAFSGSNAESVSDSGYESCNPTSDQPWSIVFPCSDSVTYYGRGSKQLSWNYNYGLFSKAMYNDATVLLNEPRRVAESWLAFASGIWFAVTPQSPKPPMTWALDGTWQKNDIDSAAGLAPGFGSTIEIINGGYECRSATTTPQASNRIKSYKAFSELFGLEIPADEPNDCAGSKGFPTNSPVATNFYWAKDWSKPNACKLGTVQTPFTVVTPGDYGRCVDFYWRSHVLLNGIEIIRNGETVF